MGVNNRLLVERLAENDAAEVAWLLKEVWPKAWEYPKKWREERVIENKQIVDEMKNDFYYFGIRANGRVVGMYKASLNRDVVVGEHQSVHLDYRGLGLAKTMYNHLIGFAKDIGCTKVHVNILPSQTASIRIVEKNGFTRIRVYEQVPKMLVYLYELEV